MGKDVNLDSLAIHEASHFIVYLLNCKEERKQPRVYELSLFPKDNKSDAYIMIKHDSSPNWTLHFLNSDLPHELKDEYRANILREIKYLLAGIAGETQQNQTQDYKKVLTTFYRSEKKDSNSDLSKAILYNTAIGEQKQKEGALPLLNSLKGAVLDVSTHWDKVIHVAQLLQSKRAISGDDLKRLVELYS